MNIVERVKAPTPKFFKVLRTVGISVAAVSASILAAPVVLPTALVTLAGYAAFGGAIISAVSQTAVDDSSTLRQAQGDKETKSRKNPSTTLRVTKRRKDVGQ